MLSLRYLRARRKEGFISVIAGFSFVGIMLGVATLIIVMAVMNGFRHELLNKILGLNGHMLVQPIGTPLTDYAAVADRLLKIKGITHAIPLVEGQALASSPFHAGGVLVRGLREQDLKQLPAIGPNIKSGTLEGFDTGQGVVIGKRLADQLSVRAGDQVTLVSPRGAVTPMGTTPRIKTYKVAAIFEIGMSEYDSVFVFMPLTEAQAYFNRSGDVNAIEIYTENADQVLRYRQLVNDNAGREVYIVDWRQRNSSFFSALQVERTVMFMILTLDRTGRCTQHHLGPHPPRQRQEPRHCNPAHDGCHQIRGDAHIPDHGLEHRDCRHLVGFTIGLACLSQHRGNSPLRFMADVDAIIPARALLS